MFPVETLPAQYCEEREAARKLADEQRKAAEAAQVKAPVATKQASAGSLAQALQTQTPPALSRPGSSSVLGSIFQNFRRSGSPGSLNSPSPAASMAPSRTQTPVLQTASTELEKAAVEAMKRDAESYPALPGWY